jgi:hypothetical protein
VGDHAYSRKVRAPMLMWKLMMVVVVVVVEEVVKKKVEARYVEKDFLEVSFYWLYPLKVSLVAALQRS